MSGGHFGYDQYKIGYMAESIEKLIERNGREKTAEELKVEGYHDQDWYRKYPEDLYHYKYPDEVIEEFKKGVELLKQAEIYAHHIDYLVSGDDGNESFLKRLKEDLNKNKL